jgi:hypothetical protein
MINGTNLTANRLQEWINTQPQPTTKAESHALKKAKRLINLSKDEEKE